MTVKETKYATDLCEMEKALCKLNKMGKKREKKNRNCKGIQIVGDSPFLCQYM